MGIRRRIVALFFCSVLCSTAKASILYPQNKSVVLSDTVKVVFDHAVACKYKALVQSAEKSPELSLTQEGPIVQVQIPKDIQGDFELSLQGERCEKYQLQLHRFKGTPQELGAKIFKHYSRLNPVEELSYNWTTAILLYGLSQYSEKNSSEDGKKVQEYIKNFFSHWLSKGIPEITSPDLAAMSLPAAELHKQDQKFDLEKVFLKTKEFFDQEPINKIGALNHIGNRHRFFWWMPLTKNFVADSIWIDSSMMYILNGVLLAEATKSEQLKEFALKQPLIFAQYLQDETGLFKHAYYLETGEKTPAESFWSRGNGWMAVCLSQLIDKNMGPSEEYKSILEKQLQAIGARMLGPVYVANTLFDSKSSYNYPETSGTALMAFALAKGQRLGIKSGDLKKAEQMAIDIGGYVTVDGNGDFSLGQVSRATDSFAYDWYYTILIRTKADVSYGVGAYMLLLQELQKNGMIF